MEIVMVRKGGRDGDSDGEEGRDGDSDGEEGREGWR